MPKHLGSAGAVLSERGGERGCSRCMWALLKPWCWAQGIPPAFPRRCQPCRVLGRGLGCDPVPSAGALGRALGRLAGEGCLDVCVISCGQCKPFPETSSLWFFGSGSFFSLSPPLPELTSWVPFPGLRWARGERGCMSLLSWKTQRGAGESRVPPGCSPPAPSTSGWWDGS